MNVDIYTCFIDYRKAFDCVSHHRMVEILRANGNDTGDLRIISAANSTSEGGRSHD